VSRKRLLVLVALVALPLIATSWAGATAAIRNSSAVPTVNLIDPTHGSNEGGTKVAIVGTNLTGTDAVEFGGRAATTFVVDSDNSLTAVSPPGTGTVHITVTTPNGTSQTSSADQFTYIARAPIVSAVSPSQGPITGGTRVTILGSDFENADAVHFGATPATSFDQKKGNLISVVSPAGSGTVDITVTTPNGTSQTSPADQFTFVVHSPTVRLVVPARGASSGGTTVTVLGGSFKDVRAVDFGANPAENFTVNSNHQITAVSPPGTGSVDVTVTTDQGTSAITPRDQFTYGFASPTVSFIVPTDGSALGGARVTVVGTGLAGVTAVDFGTNPSPRFKVNSDQSVTATAPPGTGVVDVTVTTPQGTSATSPADLFTYVLHPPVIKRVVPSSGSAGGGTAVPIIGNYLNGAMSVDFGGTPATNFQVNSNHAITATSPAGSGSVDITVTTSQGTSVLTSVDRFTYQ
jgi:hypothetical protein